MIQYKNKKIKNGIREYYNETQGLNPSVKLEKNRTGTLNEKDKNYYLIFVLFIFFKAKNKMYIVFYIYCYRIGRVVLTRMKN